MNAHGWQASLGSAPPPAAAAELENTQEPAAAEEEPSGGGGGFCGCCGSKDQKDGLLLEAEECAATTMTEPAAAGDTVLQVEANEGFEPGTEAMVGNEGDADYELVVVESLGSLHLMAPLQHPHEAGTSIKALPPPPALEEESLEPQPAAAAPPQPKSEIRNNRKSKAEKPTRSAAALRTEPTEVDWTRADPDKC